MRIWVPVKARSSSAWCYGVKVCCVMLCRGVLAMGVCAYSVYVSVLGLVQKWGKRAFLLISRVCVVFYRHACPIRGPFLEFFSWESPVWPRTAGTQGRTISCADPVDVGCSVYRCHIRPRGSFLKSFVEKLVDVILYVTVRVN